MDAKLYNFNGPNSNNEIPAHDYVMSSGLNHVKTELQNQFCDYVKTEIEKAQLGNTKDGQGSSKGKVADTTVLDKLKHFMAMSTFHGISHISSSNQLWMRMFWLVLLLCKYFIAWSPFRPVSTPNYIFFFLLLALYTPYESLCLWNLF